MGAVRTKIFPLIAWGIALFLGASGFADDRANYLQAAQNRRTSATDWQTKAKAADEAAANARNSKDGQAKGMNTTGKETTQDASYWDGQATEMRARAVNDMGEAMNYQSEANKLAQYDSDGQIPLSNKGGTSTLNIPEANRAAYAADAKDGFVAPQDMQKYGATVTTPDGVTHSYSGAANGAHTFGNLSYVDLDGATSGNLGTLQPSEQVAGPSSFTSEGAATQAIKDQFGPAGAENFQVSGSPASGSESTPASSTATPALKGAPPSASDGEDLFGGAHPPSPTGSATTQAPPASAQIFTVLPRIPPQGNAKPRTGS